MNQIIRPHITEKTIEQSKKGLFTFLVKPSSTKKTLKPEIENLFKVNVVKITTTKVPSKTKRIGRSFRTTQTGTYKKATVQLKKDQKISLFEIAK